jgi:hypothetical protein
MVMVKGFIYVIDTLNRDYEQKDNHNVPTQFGDRLYFGPCKIPMRPRMKPGDYFFGISPKKIGPRRIVCIGHIEKRITFKKAYERLPELRASGKPGGRQGPIHVRPINRTGPFPYSSYEHIPHAMHPDPDWKKDLASPELDAFFVCSTQSGCVGRWLGKGGPEIDNEILNFIKKCPVYGQSAKGDQTNDAATLQHPIRRKGQKGFLYTGLHLETDKPEVLIRLCETRTTLIDRPEPDKKHKGGNGSCSRSKTSKSSRCR